MKETYEVTTLAGDKVKFDKQTNLMIKNGDGIKGEEYSKMLLEVQNILSSSPYSTYTPSYLNPNDSRDRSYFLGWRDLYLKEPAKGSIAPWSKEEKEYYLSLKSKKERYIYLVKRSGLKCAIIDIPQEAIGNAKEFPEITALVEGNRGTLKSYLHIGEWNLCAGILGDANGFIEAGEMANLGFKARAKQALILAIQLGVNIRDRQKNPLLILQESYEARGILDGERKNLLKASIIENLAKNIQPDEFGMLPFIDEMIGVDWIMDFNKFPYALNSSGSLIRNLNKQIKAGKLLDPREARANKKTREEFRMYMNEKLKVKKQEYSDYGFPKDWNNQDIELYIDSTLLEAKVMAVTPPQGYINAPYYYFPEELDELFEAGKLDRKLDPTIPAYKRVGFPQDLVKKIEEFKEK